MPTLHVHLREGFEGERVLVAVDGRVVFDQPAVHTRTQLGLATQLQVDVADGPTAVRVELPARGRTLDVSVDAASTPWLGVSVEQGEIVATPSGHAFGYA